MRWFTSTLVSLCLFSQGQLRAQSSLPLLHVGFPGATGVTITYNSAGSGNNSTGSSTCTIAITSTSGNLIVAEISTNTLSNTLTISGGSYTWTQISGSPFTDSGSHIEKAYWYTVANTSTSVTVTFTQSVFTNTATCAVASYSASTGWPSAPLDVTTNKSNLAYATGTSINSGTTGTTAFPKELAVGLFSGLKASGGSAYSAAAGSGYTLRQSNVAQPAISAIEDQVLSATGTQTAALTWTYSGTVNTMNSADAIAVFYPNPTSAITLVAHSIGSPTTTGVDTTGATLIVVHCAAGSTSTAVTDSKGNTLTALTNQGSGTTSRLFYVTSPITGTGHTFSCNGSLETAAMEAFSFAGAFDQQNGSAPGVVTSAQPGSITPTAPFEVVITGFTFTAVNPATINSGYTITDQQGVVGGVSYGNAMGYLIQTAPAATNPTWNNSGASGQMITTIASFKHN